ncbi:Ig-like domain-containing protein, partial [Halomonas halmophila]|uniref:Ig-like domain-containing protein n=1 Tax=Halomonas halmophila TaxID=252 RepID=UPI001C3FF482
YSTDGGTTWTEVNGTSFTLPEGEYAEGDVVARQTDPAGNTSDNGQLGEVVIDTSAPDAPTIDATDGNELSGTAEAGSTVNVDTNGDGETDQTATADGDGNWSVTPDTPLEDGTEVSATATDAAGNESQPTTETVDAAAPAAPVIVDATDDTTPLTDDLASGDSTNDLTPTLNGTAEAGSTVEVFQDGTSVGTVTADGDGDWSFTPASELAEGEVSFTAEATDAVGNTSPTSDSFDLTLDTTAPTNNDGTHT